MSSMAESMPPSRSSPRGNKRTCKRCSFSTSNAAAYLDHQLHAHSSKPTGVKTTVKQNSPKKLSPSPTKTEELPRRRSLRRSSLESVLKKLGGDQPNANSGTASKKYENSLKKEDSSHANEFLSQGKDASRTLTDKVDSELSPKSVVDLSSSKVSVDSSKIQSATSEKGSLNNSSSITSQSKPKERTIELIIPADTKFSQQEVNNNNPSGEGIGKIIFSCDRCKFATMSQLEMQHHQQAGHVTSEHLDFSQRKNVSIQDRRMSTDSDEGILTIDDGSRDDMIKNNINLPTRTYSCQICGASTNSSRKHLHHQLEEHGCDFTIYECDLCDYATKYKQKLPRHRKCHYSNSPYTTPAALHVNKGSESDGSDGDWLQKPQNGQNIKQGEFSSSLSPSFDRDGSGYEKDSKDDKVKFDENTAPNFEFESSRNLSPLHSMLKKTQLSLARELGAKTPEASAVKPKRNNPPIREAVDPAKYIRIQDVDGIKFACSKCGNIYKWRKSLNKHWKEKHDGEAPPQHPSNFTMLNVPNMPKSQLPRQGSPYIRPSSRDKIDRDESPMSSLGKLTNSLGSHMSTPASSQSYQTPSSGDVMPNRWTSILSQAFNNSSSTHVPPNSHSYPPGSSNNQISPSSTLSNSSTGSILETKFPMPNPFLQVNGFENRSALYSSPFSHVVPLAAHNHGMKQIIEDQDSDLQPLDLSKTSKFSGKNEPSEVLDLSKANHDSAPSRTDDVGGKAIHCGGCQHRYSSMSELNTHFHDMHLNLLQDFQSDDYDSGLETSPPPGSQLFRYLTQEERNKICIVCCGNYSWQLDLARHFASSHPTLPNPYNKRAGDMMTPPEAKRQKLSSNILQCPQCPYLAREENELLRHQLVHSFNRPFACTMCGFSSQYEEELSQHIKRYHDLTSPMKNENEGDKSAYLSQLGLLSTSSPEPGLIRSSSMHELNKSPDALAIDLLSFSSGGKPRHKGRTGRNNNAEMLLPYKCNVCEYRARWPSEIAQHMKNHSDEKPFHCPRCSYKSKWKWDVVKHLKRCGGGTVNDVIDTTKDKKSANPPWLKALQYKTTNSNGLVEKSQANSMYSSGPPNVTVVPGISSENEVISKMENMEDKPVPYGHETDEAMQKLGTKTAANTNQYFCPKCPFMGNSPAELKRHSRVHSDEKPFVCKSCGYSSKWKCDLKKHLRTYNHLAAPQVAPGAQGKSDINGMEERNSESIDKDEDKSTLYSCNECQYATHKKSAFDGHIKIHLNSHKSSHLLCKQCDFEAHDLPSFLQHKLSHSMEKDDEKSRRRRKPVKQFSCMHCPYTSFDRSTMSRHEVMHDMSLPAAHLCSYCSLGSDDKEYVETHEKLHPEYYQAMSMDRNAACSKERDGATRKPSRLKVKNHMNSMMRKPRKFKCKQCKFTTVFEDHYKSHLMQHRIKSAYCCDVCSFRSKSWKEFKLHLATHEQIPTSEAAEYFAELKESNTLMQSKQGKYACDQCLFKSNNKVECKHHQSLHGANLTFQCDHCDYSINDYDLIIMHRELHSSETGYSGEVSRKSLRKSTTDVFRCPKCPYTCKTSSSFKKHHSWMHGRGLQYVCDSCDWSSQLLPLMNIHRQLHAGEKDFIPKVGLKSLKNSCHTRC